MNVVGVVAILLAGVAGLLPFAPALRLRASRPRGSAEPSVSLLRRARAPLTALAAYGGWTFVGGHAGLAVGAVAGAIAWKVLTNVESPAIAERRRQLRQDLPFAVHLLAGLVASGAEVASAMRDVGHAVGGPVAEEWRWIDRELAIAGDPLDVWRRVAEIEGLQPMGASLARSYDSGAPVTDALARLADELSAKARHEVEARVRTIEVRAAAPLGVCFLPAFVILGVVPTVASMFAAMSFLS